MLAETQEAWLLDAIPATAWDTRRQILIQSAPS